MRTFNALLTAVMLLLACPIAGHDQARAQTTAQAGVPFFAGYLAEGTGIGSFTENGDASYARQAVTFSPLDSGRAYLATGVTFNETSAETITQRGLYDASTGGHLIAWWGLSRPVKVSAGGTDTVQAGSLKHTFPDTATFQQRPGAINWPAGATIGVTNDNNQIYSGVALQVSGNVVSAASGGGGAPSGAAGGDLSGTYPNPTVAKSNGTAFGTAAFQPTTAFDASGAAAAVQAGDLQKANNLSDLANAATARTNLGLGTAATTAASAYDPAGAATTAQNAPNVSGATGTLPAANTSALTGDVTKAAGSSATTVTQFNGSPTITIANGGTGATSATAALDNLSGSPAAGSAGLLARLSTNTYAVVQNLTTGLCGAATNLFTAPICANFFGYYDPRWYGAKFNGLMLTDISTTNGSAVVTSASYTFTSADIGKYVVLPTGASSTANAAVTTTISSVSGMTATLGGSLSATASNLVMYFGADDTTAIQSAISAAALNGSGLVQLPQGIAMIGAGGAGLNFSSYVSMQGRGMHQSALIWDYFGNGGHGVIYALTGAYNRPYVDNHFSDFEVSAAAMSSYSTTAKIFYMQYLLRPVFTRLYLHDAPATIIGTDYVSGSVMTDNMIVNGGRLNNGTQAGGAGIGIGTNGSTINDATGNYTQGAIVEGNTIYMSQGSRFGVFFEQQGTNAPVNPLPIRIANNFIYSSNGHGIQDAGGTGMVIEGNQVYGTSAAGCLDGISVGSGSGGTTVGTQDVIVGNDVQGMRNGIGIDYSTNGYSTLVPVNSIVASNHLHSNVNAGISVVGNGTNPLKGLKISGNVAYQNGAAGITLSGGAGLTDVDVSDNQLLNNAATTATTTQKAGISVNAAITRMQIVGNVASDNMTGTQNYGLIIAASSAVTGSMSDNNFTGNATGALSLASTFTGLLANNVGFPAFTVSGCAATTPVGQGDVGTFLSGTSGTCATTILPYGTANIIAPNGWSCVANDLTTPTDLIGQTASTTTGCTLTGTTVSGDKAAVQMKAF